MDLINRLNEEIPKKYELRTPIADIKTDGSVNRFDSVKMGDNAIWVCVHEFIYKGNFNWVAVFGSWREGTQHTIKSYNPGEAREKKFYETEKAAIKESQKRLDQEKKEKYKSCREKWAPIFQSLPQESETYEYLKNKKIGSNFLARVDAARGVLYVPAWNAKREFVGAQRIFKDPETGKFEKRFTYGIEKKGSFCPFGDVANAEFIYIAEGFATAASIAMAFKNDPTRAVVAVWDTSNLLEGAKAIRQVNPSSYLIFAADRDINADRRFHNIGERKAIFAANQLSNALVKTVDFDTPNESWSDYNDLHQFEGLDKVAMQLHCEMSDFIEIIPLGFNGSKHYYFASHRKQILEWGKSDHTPASFTLLAPEKYWGDRYGYVVKSDGTRSNNANFKKVIEGLGKEVSEKGLFDFSKIRGVGAWEHDGSVIVNTGDRLFYRGDYYPLYNNGLESKYFYEAGPVNKVDFSRPLSNADAIKFVEAFQLLNYKNKADFITVLGWVYCAQIFAALPWRPHIWFTGPRGSGKSTILNYINDVLMSSIIVQDSTTAGIRQELKNDAMAIVTDEAEPNTERDRAKLQDLLMLARQCSTRSDYKVLRGSSSGQALTYNTNAAFCMGSIQISKMGGADTSRFFVIEMKSVKEQTREDFIRLENAMTEIRPLVEGLFVRAVINYESFIKNIETAKGVIRGRKIESRQADQLAPIIAGYYAYFNTGIMDESFVIRTIEEMNFEQSDYAQANEESDEESCVEAILSLKVRGENMTVGQLIEKYRITTQPPTREYFDELLGIFGIRYCDQENNIFVSSNSGALKRELENITNFSDYSNILKRHDGFIETKKMRVSGKSVRGVLLSLNQV